MGIDFPADSLASAGQFNGAWPVKRVSLIPIITEQWRNFTNIDDPG
jgi:hypothetical protein